MQTTRQLGDAYFEQPHSFAVVSITDDGPGIHESVQSNIFDPLVTTKTKGEGTGLGLYICQRIIRAHKGEIIFYSVPGKTTFEVWLPLEG